MFLRNAGIPTTTAQCNTRRLQLEALCDLNRNVKIDTILRTNFKWSFKRYLKYSNAFILDNEIPSSLGISNRILCHLDRIRIGSVPTCGGPSAVDKPCAHFN